MRRAGARPPHEPPANDGGWVVHNVLGFPKMPRACAAPASCPSCSPSSGCSRRAPWPWARGRGGISSPAPAPGAGPGARERTPLRRPADRERPGPPHVRRRGAPATPTACGCSSSPAASSASGRGAARTVLDLRRRRHRGRGAGPARHGLPPRLRPNRRLFLHGPIPGDTRVAEFRAAPRRDRVAGRAALLHVDQPEENHNGGAARLRARRPALPRARRRRRRVRPAPHRPGPDSARQAPRRRRRRAGPPRWDVVLTGLRNPWRFSFDPALGELWIGDVGQDEVEEVDRVRLELDEPPKNLGWSAFEGARRSRATTSTAAASWCGPSPPTRTTGLLDHRRGRLRRRRAALARPPLRLRGLLRGPLWTLDGEPGRPARRRPARASHRAAAHHIGMDADGELVFASGTGAIYPRCRRGSG